MPPWTPRIRWCGEPALSARGFVMKLPDSTKSFKPKIKSFGGWTSDVLSYDVVQSCIHKRAFCNTTVSGGCKQ